MRRSDPWMALDEEKFDRWQPNLLALLNDPKLKRFARWRMGLSHHVGCGDEIMSLSPHHFTVPLRGDQFRSTFMPQPALQKGLYRAWKPVFWAMHHYDSLLDRTAQRWVQSLIRPMRPAFGLSTLTAYPQAGGGGSNVTCDGCTQFSGGQDSFVTVIAEAANAVFVINPTNRVQIIAAEAPNQFGTLERGFASFDTSSLGSSATISTAVVSLFGNGYTDDIGDTSLEVVASTQAAANNLVTADHAQVGSTSFGSFSDIGQWGTGSYSAINLNSSGLAAISKTSVTKFAFRLGWDREGAFGGSWVSEASTLYVWFASDYTSNTAPTLVVTYTVPFTITMRRQLSALGTRMGSRQLQG